MINVLKLAYFRSLEVCIDLWIHLNKMFYLLSCVTNEQYYTGGCTLLQQCGANDAKDNSQV